MCMSSNVISSLTPFRGAGTGEAEGAYAPLPFNKGGILKNALFVGRAKKKGPKGPKEKNQIALKKAGNRHPI